MKKAVFVDGVRTPFLKVGTLPGLTAVEAGTAPVQYLLGKYNGLKDQVDLMIGANIGNQVLAPDGSNITRLILLNADIPERVGAWTVNINCASSLHAIIDAAKNIELGLAKCVLAIGVEVMSDYGAVYSRGQREVFNQFLKASRSKLPWYRKIPAQLWASAKITLLRHEPIWMLNHGLTDPRIGMRMDKIGDWLAKMWEISREDQDKFALESQHRAAVAQKSGRLAKEICPLRDVNKDNGIRQDTTLEKLSQLKPVYPGGTVTPGNASQVTDGACAVLLAEEEFARSLGWPVTALISSQRSGVSGRAPENFGVAPVGAIKQILDRTGLKLSDFSVIETNEAFASVVIAQSRAMAADWYSSQFGWGEPIGKLALDITNVNGGAIAIGHPLAASGARLVLTCVRELENRDKAHGLVTLCAAGGLGEALAIERRKP